MNTSDFLASWFGLKGLDPNGLIQFNYKHIPTGAYDKKYARVGLFTDVVPFRKEQREQDDGALSKVVTWQETYGAVATEAIIKRSWQERKTVSFSPITRKPNIDSGAWATSADLHQSFGVFVDADRGNYPLTHQHIEKWYHKYPPTHIVKSSSYEVFNEKTNQYKEYFRYHLYWKFDRVVDLAEEENIVYIEALQRYFASLGGFKWMPLTQAMGLPNSINFKHDNEPTRDILYHSGKSYHPDTWLSNPKVLEEINPVSTRRYGLLDGYPVAADAEIPKWAYEQLAHPEFHGGRDNSIFAVAIGLKDKYALSEAEVEQFVMTEINKHGSLYADGSGEYSDEKVSKIIRSAFRRK